MFDYKLFKNAPIYKLKALAQAMRIRTDGFTKTEQYISSFIHHDSNPTKLNHDLIGRIYVQIVNRKALKGRGSASLMLEGMKQWVLEDDGNKLDSNHFENDSDEDDSDKEENVEEDDSDKEENVEEDDSDKEENVEEDDSDKEENVEEDDSDTEENVEVQEEDNQEEEEDNEEQGEEETEEDDESIMSLNSASDASITSASIEDHVWTGNQITSPDFGREDSVGILKLFLSRHKSLITAELCNKKAVVPLLSAIAMVVSARIYLRRSSVPSDLVSIDSLISLFLRRRHLLQTILRKISNLLIRCDFKKSTIQSVQDYLSKDALERNIRNLKNKMRKGERNLLLWKTFIFSIGFTFSGFQPDPRERV